VAVSPFFLLLLVVFLTNQRFCIPLHQRSFNPSLLQHLLFTNMIFSIQFITLFLLFLADAYRMDTITAASPEFSNLSVVLGDCALAAMAAFVGNVLLCLLLQLLRLLRLLLRFLYCTCCSLLGCASQRMVQLGWLLWQSFVKID
jgi:hypothetical protein